MYMCVPCVYMYLTHVHSTLTINVYTCVYNISHTWKIRITSVRLIFKLSKPYWGCLLTIAAEYMYLL